MEYRKAKQMAEKNKGKVYTYDSGDGYTSHAVWCNFRGRVIVRATKDGIYWI